MITHVSEGIYTSEERMSFDLLSTYISACARSGQFVKTGTFIRICGGLKEEFINFAYQYLQSRAFYSLGGVSFNKLEIETWIKENYT